MSGVPSPSSRRGQPQHYHITYHGGETFQVSSEPSTFLVLKGELIGPKERRFLQERLQYTPVAFSSLEHSFNIWLRCAWQYGAENQLNGLDHAQARRSASTVLCLHDMDGPLTSSWSWAKFVRPFFRRGFSVILVELPGFGRSQVGMKARVDPKSWREYYATLIVKVLEMSQLCTCHIAASGSAATILVQALQQAPHRLESHHFLFNPAFDLDFLFPVGKLNKNSDMDDDQCRAAKRAMQANQFENLMRKTKANLWCTFDADSRPNRPDTTRMFLREVGVKLCYLRSLFYTEIGPEDITEAQMDPQIAERLYVPSGKFKRAVADFMFNPLRPHVKPGQTPGPEHRHFMPDCDFVSTHCKTVVALDCLAAMSRSRASIRRAVTPSSHAETDDEEDGHPMRGSAPSITASMGSLPRSGNRDASLTSENLGRGRSRSLGQGGSSSSGSRRNWAKVAEQRLRTTTPPNAGVEETKDYSKMPFEPALSYGARKLRQDLTDTLQVSMDSLAEDERRRAKKFRDLPDCTVRNLHSMLRPPRSPAIRVSFAPAPEDHLPNVSRSWPGSPPEKGNFMSRSMSTIGRFGGRSP